MSGPPLRDGCKVSSGAGRTQMRQWEAWPVGFASHRRFAPPSGRSILRASCSASNAPNGAEQAGCRDCWRIELGRRAFPGSGTSVRCSGLARVAKLADAPDLGSGTARYRGSSPLSRTWLSGSHERDAGGQRIALLRRWGERWVVRRLTRGFVEPTPTSAASSDAGFFGVRSDQAYKRDGRGADSLIDAPFPFARQSVCREAMIRRPCGDGMPHRRHRANRWRGASA